MKRYRKDTPTDPIEKEYELLERLPSNSRIDRITAEIRSYEAIAVAKRQITRLATIARQNLQWRSPQHAVLVADHAHKIAGFLLRSNDKLLRNLETLRREQILTRAESPDPSPPKQNPKLTVDILSDTEGPAERTGRTQKNASI